MPFTLGIQDGIVSFDFVGLHCRLATTEELTVPVEGDRCEEVDA